MKHFSTTPRAHGFGLFVLSLVSLTLMGNLARAETPHAADSPDAIDSLLAAIVGGSPSLNARLRYEHAESDAAADADALTLRTRLGYSSLPYHGLRAFVEFENVTSLGDDDDYNQAGLNPGGADKTVIADVEGTELNQIFIEWTCPSTGNQLKVGRQRLILGNARFVGNVGWRQNEQTYDAAVLKTIEKYGLQLTYGYIDTVRRIFGQENGSDPAGGAGNAARYSSDSHLVNLGFSPCSGLSSTAYAYLLDLGDGAVGSANSSDTYGISATMKHKAENGLAATCMLEYAQQSDNSASPDAADYSADYYRVDLGGSLDGYGLGAGLEVLGSDNGATFRTPLATGHKFNGWADVFLTAPAGGLQDLYAYLSGTCSLTGMKAIIVYHSFESDAGNIEYGDEIDVVAAKKINSNLTLIAKYANYQADSAADNPRASDVERISIEASLAF